MNLFQLVGMVLLAVLAFYAARWALAVWNARAREVATGRQELGWTDTRPRGLTDRIAEIERVPGDFSDDTAPAVLSMPFGLDDDEPPAPRERGRRRAS